MWVHLIPHSTHPQSSSLHGAVKAGSLSEIEKRALPPTCLPSFNFQSTRSQELRSHCCHQCLLSYCSIITMKVPTVLCFLFPFVADTQSVLTLATPQRQCSDQQGQFLLYCLISKQSVKSVNKERLRCWCICQRSATSLCVCLHSATLTNKLTWITVFCYVCRRIESTPPIGRAIIKPQR